MPDRITRVAEIPAPDSPEAREVIEVAMSMVPEALRGGIPTIGGASGLVIGAMAAKACMDLPEGAVVERVVIVARVP